MMPKMDGITFNNKIKQNNKTASIPLIFLTAKSSQENHLLGIREGGDDYITKPFSPDLLVARVQNLIHSRMRLRELYSIGFRNSDTSSETDPFLIKVNEIISKYFSDPSFNVSELANALYLDRSHVLRTLKEKTGLTPSDYIKKYRMESALEMLKSKAGNISEISYAAGFNSLSYFSYVFKEYFKVSPSEYLSQIHNND